MWFVVIVVFVVVVFSFILFLGFVFSVRGGDSWPSLPLLGGTPSPFAVLPSSSLWPVGSFLSIVSSSFCTCMSSLLRCWCGWETGWMSWTVFDILQLAIAHSGGALPSSYLLLPSPPTVGRRCLHLRQFHNCQIFLEVGCFVVNLFWCKQSLQLVIVVRTAVLIRTVHF